MTGAANGYVAGQIYYDAIMVSMRHSILWAACFEWLCSCRATAIRDAPDDTGQQWPGASITAQALQRCTALLVSLVCMQHRTKALKSAGQI